MKWTPYLSKRPIGTLPFPYNKDIRDAVEQHNKNKAPFFTYSRLGRGFLTHTYKSPTTLPKEYQETLPWILKRSVYKNLKLIDKLDELLHVGMSLEARLHWPRSLIIPILDSSNAQCIDENICLINIKLSVEEQKEISDFLDKFEIKGIQIPCHSSESVDEVCSSIHGDYWERKCCSRD
ncbi:hypothetical protein L204_105611 [Cryptococcus depauperatus]